MFKSRSFSGSMERPLQLSDKQDPAINVKQNERSTKGAQLNLLTISKKQVSFEDKVDIVTSSSDDNVFEETKHNDSCDTINQ
uniref:Uncharacterized protein n=1 Tax=Ciona savignyi TaxID=51511 RepID=H2YJ62_CIOSA